MSTASTTVSPPLSLSVAPGEIALLELTAALDRGESPVLLEALPAVHFERGHLPGALRIDHAEAPAQAAALGLSTDADIVVYCASATCRNSHLAAAALTRAGYQHVRVFTGGKALWQEAGRALATG